MRRGFKAYTERLSLETRSGLGLQPDQAIDPKAMVQARGCIVWTPHEIPGLGKDHLKQLLDTDPESWDGATIKEGKWIVIVINPSRPVARQMNTIMHEWAHLELKHKPSRVDRFENGLLLLSDYPKELEDEANWLSGAMLAPREGLARLRRRGFDEVQIAKAFGVSIELATWRLRMTGVDRQMRSRLGSP